jgi:hypothetical protein
MVTNDSNSFRLPEEWHGREVCNTKSDAETCVESRYRDKLQSFAHKSSFFGLACVIIILRSGECQ